MSKSETVKQIRIKFVKSMNGAKDPHRRTIRALGLTKLQSEVVKNATPEILGMVHLVRHLVQVTEVA